MSEKEITFNEGSVVHTVIVDDEGTPIKKTPLSKVKNPFKIWRFALISGGVFLFSTYFLYGGTTPSENILATIQVGITSLIIYNVSESKKIKPWLKVILYPLIIFGCGIVFFICSVILLIIFRILSLYI